MSEEQEKPKLVFHFGILQMPMVHAAFSLPDGSNPFADAVLELTDQVLNETVSKLLVAVRIMCEKHGFDFKVMEPELMHKMAKAAINKDDPMDREDRGVLVDGEPILDEDYANTISAGRSTKN